MSLIPILLMKNRVKTAREESDTAAFFHLLYFGEMILKITCAGLVGAIVDDSERHRYRQLHRLVRADGLGEWSTVIDDILTGPAAQFLTPSVRLEQRELIQRHQEGTWQYDAVHLLSRALEELDSGRERLPNKIDARRWFSLFSELRNRTRGHGAVQGAVCSRLAPALERSIGLVESNFSLFRRPWVYLHRNLSKKYRVTKLSEDTQPFDYLRSDGSPLFENGIYVQFDSHAKVELLKSDPDATDFFLPNGGFNGKRFEWISYITDAKTFADATPYLVPATALPPSETRGLGNLDVCGRCFANLPPAPAAYVSRPVLEEELLRNLLDDRHPVITVRGAGGIGKTSLAVRVLHRVAQEDRFGAILWFSSRDIDLLAAGPKDVKPQVLTESDIAREFVQLMCPLEQLLVARLAKAMEMHDDEFEATDCSRLAWLYLRLHQEDKARSSVEKGLGLDSSNEFCLRLKEKLLLGQRADARRWAN